MSLPTQESVQRCVLSQLQAQGSDPKGSFHYPTVPFPCIALQMNNPKPTLHACPECAMEVTHRHILRKTREVLQDELLTAGILYSTVYVTDVVTLASEIDHMELLLMPSRRGVVLKNDASAWLMMMDKVEGDTPSYDEGDNNDNAEGGEDVTGSSVDNASGEEACSDPNCFLCSQTPQSWAH